MRHRIHSAMVDWSSLPSDLVNRIADCFLATNDLDYYMDFRAVCRNWRSATDDPNNPEVRFRPRRWMAVDDGLYLNSRDSSRVLANTVTGRILRKDLPLLRNYFVIAATHGGFFVLADRKPPHSVLILNPFTGHMIRFMAPVPSYRLKDVLAAVSGSAPTLILISDEICSEYRADPASECFSVYKQVDTYSVSNRLAVIGGIYAGGEHGSVATMPAVVARKIYELITMFPEPSQVPADVMVDHPVDAQPPNTVFAGHYPLAEFSGEVFAVVNLQNHMVVFKLDTETEALVPVKSIRNLAIFIGYRRCFIVNADKFPTMDANCIYYLKSTDIVLFIDICMYDLKDQKEERVCECIHSFSPTTRGFPDPPFSIVQHLASFTFSDQEYEIGT